MKIKVALFLLFLTPVSLPPLFATINTTDNSANSSPPQAEVPLDNSTQTPVSEPGDPTNLAEFFEPPPVSQATQEGESPAYVDEGSTEGKPSNLDTFFTELAKALDAVKNIPLDDPQRVAKIKKIYDGLKAFAPPGWTIHYSFDKDYNVDGFTYKEPKAKKPKKDEAKKEEAAPKEETSKEEKPAKEEAAPKGPEKEETTKEKTPFEKKIEELKDIEERIAELEEKKRNKSNDEMEIKKIEEEIKILKEKRSALLKEMLPTLKEIWDSLYQKYLDEEDPLKKADYERQLLELAHIIQSSEQKINTSKNELDALIADLEYQKRLLQIGLEKTSDERRKQVLEEEIGRLQTEINNLRNPDKPTTEPQPAAEPAPADK